MKQENLVMASRVGEQIKIRRIALGMTQVELARKIGHSSAAYINFLESGKRNLSLRDLLAISKTLGATVANIIGESSHKIDPLTALRGDLSLTKEQRETLTDFYLFLKSK